MTTTAKKIISETVDFHEDLQVGEETAERIILALRASGFKIVPIEQTNKMMHESTMIAPTWDDDVSRAKYAAMLKAFSEDEPNQEWETLSLQVQKLSLNLMSAHSQSLENYCLYKEQERRTNALEKMVRTYLMRSDAGYTETGWIEREFNAYLKADHTNPQTQTHTPEADPKP